MISGVEAETKLSLLMPKFLTYHSVALGIEFTVKTRWSRDLINAAGLDIFLENAMVEFKDVKELDREDLREGEVRILRVNIGCYKHKRLDERGRRG